MDFYKLKEQSNKKKIALESLSEKYKIDHEILYHLFTELSFKTKNGFEKTMLTLTLLLENKKTVDDIILEFDLEKDYIY